MRHCFQLLNSLLWHFPPAHMIRQSWNYNFFIISCIPGNSHKLYKVLINPSSFNQSFLCAQEGCYIFIWACQPSTALVFSAVTFLVYHYRSGWWGPEIAMRVIKSGPLRPIALHLLQRIWWITSSFSGVELSRLQSNGRNKGKRKIPRHQWDSNSWLQVRRFESK